MKFYDILIGASIISMIGGFTSLILVLRKKENEKLAFLAKSKQNARRAKNELELIKLSMPNIRNRIFTNMRIWESDLQRAINLFSIHWDGRRDNYYYYAYEIDGCVNGFKRCRDELTQTHNFFFFKISYFRAVRFLL